MSAVLKRGDTIRAKHVIAACDVESVYERMLPEGTIPREMLDLRRAAVQQADRHHVDPQSAGAGAQARRELGERVPEPRQRVVVHGGFGRGVEGAGLDLDDDVEAAPSHQHVDLAEARA